MSRKIVFLTAATLLAACGGGSDSTAPAPLVVTAVTASTVTGEFGQAVPISVVVNTAGGAPRSGATVTFSTVGGGTVAPSTVITDASGVATAQWTLAAVGAPQSATANVVGGGAATFTALATNPWKVQSSGTLTYAGRFADPGVIGGGGAAWSTTRLGSPPELLVACSQGTVIVAVFHPNLITLNGTVTYQIDNSSRVSETWLEQSPDYDILAHPGPNWATISLVKRISVAKVFNISFRHYTGAELYVPNFSMTGLSLVLPQVMIGCPSALLSRLAPIDAISALRSAVGAPLAP